MTREEAIGSLESIRNTFLICHGEENVIDVPIDGDDVCAIDRAIETLKAEPCEDAVKREAVLNTLDAMNTALDENRTVEAYKELLKECYEELPRVTPKQRTGKWVKYAAPRCGEQHYKCTNCDNYVNFGQYGDYYTKNFKFCPACGAKMEGESE